MATATTASSFRVVLCRAMRKWKKYTKSQIYTVQQEAASTSSIMDIFLSKYPDSKAKYRLSPKYVYTGELYFIVCCIPQQLWQMIAVFTRLMLIVTAVEFLLLIHVRSKKFAKEIERVTQHCEDWDSVLVMCIDCKQTASFSHIFPRHFRYRQLLLNRYLELKWRRG
jgi:hypothetical protein